MKIDNIEEVKILLLEVEDLFMNLDEEKKKIESQVNLKDAETIDYLHELELGNLNGIEIMKISKELIKSRKERRILKNKLELLKILKGYTDIFINKGILSQTRQAIQNIENLEHHFATREYKAHVVKGLKCAKKKKEE